MKSLGRWRALGIGAAIVITAASQAALAKGKRSLLVPVSPAAVRAQQVSVPAPAKTSSGTFSFAAYQRQHISGIDRAVAGDTKGALRILNGLLTQNLPADERDRLLLSIGRVQYQAGDSTGAIETYKQVRRGGPSWLEALEERAWAHMRLGQSQEALATLKTVLTPLFKDKILSEPYFLTALAHLRVCDFRAVFRTLDLFKDRFRTRVREWEMSPDPVAKLRLHETRETIQKLNLVEAEAIQRLYIDENAKRNLGAPPKIARSSDQLNFPVDHDSDQREVWLDEVDDYRVSIKGCPQDEQKIAKKERAL